MCAEIKKQRNCNCVLINRTSASFYAARCGRKSGYFCSCCTGNTPRTTGSQLEKSVLRLAEQEGCHSLDQLCVIPTLMILFVPSDVTAHTWYLTQSGDDPATTCSLWSPCATCPLQLAASTMPLRAPTAEYPASAHGSQLPRGGQGLLQSQGMPCACQDTVPVSLHPVSCPFSSSPLGEHQRTGRHTVPLPMGCPCPPLGQCWWHGCAAAADPTQPQAWAKDLE